MENLKKIRKEKNIKQIEVAKYLNITEATYSRYESGKINIAPDMLIKLSEFFNVSTDYLLGIIDIPLSPGEIKFIKDLEIKEDQDLLKNYDLTLLGESVTPEEAKKLLEVIRLLKEKD